MKTASVFSILAAVLSRVHAQRPGPPTLRASGFPSDLSLGEDTMATCFVKKGSEGPYTMTWYKNGEAVKDTSRVKTTIKATGTSIAIDGIQVEDVANYTCTATNAEGSDALTLSLFVAEVALGEEILVGCLVKKGTAGPYRITWLKDGRDIQESERVSIAARSKTSAALRISSLRAEDVGNYTCVASNDFGTDTVTAPLIINDVPKILEFKFPASLSSGDTAHVGCIVSKGSAGPFELSWMKDGLPLSHDSSRLSVMSHKGGPVSTLTIVDVSAADSGNYTCVARNAAGSDSFSTLLAVTGAPRLQSSGFPNELSLGEETVATCFVKKGSVGPYTLTWHRDGKPVHNSDRVVVTAKATSTALSIDGMQVEDIGNYTCSATSAAGTDHSGVISERNFVVRLDSVSAPPSIRRFSFPPEIALGEEVIVVCSVKKGSPADSYSIAWQKDGRGVLETDRVSTSSQTKGSATLLIASLEPEDVGNYTCTASNAFGSDSFTAPLVVNGPPRLLEFAFPAEVGLGDEIIVPCVVRKATAGPYRIAWHKDGVSLEGSGRVSASSTSSKTSSTLRIAGLRPEDVGNYTCAASNAFGSDSFTAPLVVHDALKINEFKFPAELSPGDTVAVICVIKKGSAGPFELSWQKDGRPLEPTASLTVTSPKGGPVSTLTIVDVSARDSGNYTCVARNSAGSDRYSAHLAVTAALSVFRPPKPNSLGFPPNLGLGDDAIASCFVPRSNWPGEGLRIVWTRKNGEDLSLNRRMSLVRASESSVTLGIRDIRPEDIGNYTCVVTYGNTAESITVPLVVSASPKLREFAFPPESTLGEQILVSCAVRSVATGPHRMTWLKDGQVLEKSDRVSVSAQFKGTAAIMIADLRPEDVGNYTCVASNAFGSDSFTAALVVQGEFCPYISILRGHSAKTWTYICIIYGY
ncbi:hemicentin-1-like [Dermacentor variabilis]|uniref:hemicentin-1-like n=1 Tax=Dermacentor variabilis TaxID=34621 RepID=UPI003F5C4FC3